MIFSVSAVVPVLVAFQPVFPLIVEVREITQTGESITQQWSLVSLPEFYDSTQFAQAGFLETTWNNNRILFLLNHVALILLFLFLWRTLNRMFKKKGQPAPSPST